MIEKVVYEFPRSGLRKWLFRLLFRQDYEHMQHLISDIIHLESKVQELQWELAGKPTSVTGHIVTGATSKTYTNIYEFPQVQTEKML